ncbi:hypothetical protein QG05_14110 [Salmonella enterica subsp. enterica serovar Infantis]|nr:hypothetical protein [Salmonella enterica]EBW6019005.1 hypothetical protein [Salmonella enterica subsp. enterica serovar Infantis]ECY4977802.1 hypothetical protein [Salmonella enterica subsp. enterica serovar Infantis]EDH9410086.1 hypothetical protein [Salmonella enterica subsp. enterica serovar Infantis]EDL8669018.1 hypothetical protein [Salmonella enterica subsp. enterica serovar Infantis]
MPVFVSFPPDRFGQNTLNKNVRAKPIAKETKMGNINNAVKNDELDELTAMLQSLDKPVTKAVKASDVEKIEDLLAGLDDDISKPVSMIADEIINEKSLGDVKEELEKLEIEGESVSVIAADPTNNEGSSQSNNTDSPPLLEASKDTLKLKSKGEKSNRTSPRSRFTLEDKDDSFYLSAGLNNDVFSKDFEKAPVKAKDKILNLLNWFNGGPEISIYTIIAMRHLIDAKTTTSNSIKLALMSHPDKPYPLSTASTQAGQMMAVFPATGVATREGGNLTLNEESPIVKKFVAEYSIG